MTELDLIPATVIEQPVSADDTSPPSRGRRMWRGHDSDAAWARPALLGLLAVTAVLYLWGLGASGWANAFYSAAVQAGSHSWKAMFFGSFDSSSFITVDKPPAALWVMDISARIFGVNSWSILVPQALEGVAAVGLLYATVRRTFGATAGLIAGAVLALTPVAVLMFRFDNPDALLVLCLVGSAYALTRSLESGRTRWLVVAGALLGVGFLAKMLQVLFVVPGFALVYLAFAPVSMRRRIVALLASGAAMILAAGWWVAAVALTPAADRPYVGGSSDNSILNLIVGYNGFGRLTGHETGSVGGSGNAGGQWGPTGLTRLFNPEMGGQISWLLPAALILLVALLVVWRRMPRTHGGRAQVVLWGSWLIVTGLALSLGKGIIHPYYTVALAPAIGALVSIGVTVLWARRDQVSVRGVLAGTLAVTAVWAYVLLDRSADWHPWLRDVVLVGGLLVAAGLLVGGAAVTRRLTTVLGTAALLVGLAGPAAYALDTAATPHTGSIPSAGPTVAGAMGGPGGGGRPGGAGRPGGGRFTAAGGFTGGGTAPTGGGFTGTRPTGGGGGGAAGGIGGLLSASTPSTVLVTALTADSASYRWVAATVGSNNAAGLQLAADKPVMAIGGFNGSDPAPSLAPFETWAKAGQIHYFIGASGSGSSGFGGGGSGSTNVASQITSWVAAHYTATTIGGQTVYDLTTPAS
jgi:4-amino-4-deoxy-L-arabinose transferase-like glycosyltransferase